LNSVENQDICHLAEIADRMLLSSSSEINAIRSNSEVRTNVRNPFELSCIEKFEFIRHENLELRKMIVELKSELSDLSKLFKENNFKKTLSDRNEIDLCYYHKNFGERALKCIKPCSFEDRNLNGLHHPPMHR